VEPEVVGRAGLARILECSESTTRNLEARKEIAPEIVVGGRPLYSAAKARALKASRDARARKSLPAA
jgi:hypothetical protein